MMDNEMASDDKTYQLLWVRRAKMTCNQIW